MTPVWAVNDEPLTEGWTPSERGAGDQAGSVNRTTPEMVLKATRLVKQGKVVTLGKVYKTGIPAFGTRGWRMTIPGLPTGALSETVCACRHEQVTVFRSVACPELSDLRHLRPTISDQVSQVRRRLSQVGVACRVKMEMRSQSR